MLKKWGLLSAVLSFACVVGCADSTRDGDKTSDPTVISIASLPAGEASVDGKVVGTTPIKDLAIEPGKRTITVRSKGFHEWTKSVT